MKSTNSEKNKNHSQLAMPPLLFLANHSYQKRNIFFYLQVHSASFPSEPQWKKQGVKLNHS